VHYYEDGNVRLTTSKPVAHISIPASGSTAAEVMKQIAATEKRYQEELNRGFTALSEGSFKSLRRQLPVTRQKVEWEKVGGYRVSCWFPLLLGVLVMVANEQAVGAGYRWREAAVGG
jgi:capping protein alpha